MDAKAIVIGINKKCEDTFISNAIFEQTKAFVDISIKINNTKRAVITFEDMVYLKEAISKEEIQIGYNFHKLHIYTKKKSICVRCGSIGYTKDRCCKAERCLNCKLFVNCKGNHKTTSKNVKKLT